MSQVNLLEGLAHGEFFETIDRYQPNDDLRAVVTGIVPDWHFQRNGVWHGCQPPPDQHRPLPAQGWKIHMSASTAHAEGVLRAIVPLLAARLVPFKFALDGRMLSFMNCKQWVRQSSGKFLTIYPHDEAEFVELIEVLHQATLGFDGPYVLSDRRYKDSRIVFYRYGGIIPHPMLTADGEMEQMLVSPTGELVPDQRVPTFVMPPWVRDPCGAGDAPVSPVSPSAVPLKDGRYLVKSVIRYSNSGGIYVATDTTTGEDVIVKEGRPMVTTTEDATRLLAKEHRLLSKIAHLRVAPQPIDFFQDWEHVFLVQELIVGESLSTFTARQNVTLRPEATLEEARAFYQQFKHIFLQLADILARLHEHGIVFSDLSPSNLIIHRDTLALTILDFEAAFEEGVDNPVQIFTEGFTYIDQVAGKRSTFESDYFSMGAIMHHVLWPINQLFMISPRARYTFITNVVKDIGFPPAVCDIITGLLDRDAAKRPTPAAVRALLTGEDTVTTPWAAMEIWSPHDATVITFVRSIVDGAVGYIRGVADYDRRDRLFPADGQVFRTNPLSVAYGACGVAYVLHRVTGDTAAVADWIDRTRIASERYPAGLYVGLSGIAWTLLELGARERAEQTMDAVYTHPLRHAAADLFSGAAGCGMASLKFFAETHDERHLAEAITAGRHLLATRVDDAAGCYWMKGADIPLGLAHGASGIALFLLYLSQASGDAEFLDVGRRALAYDVSQAAESGSGVSWRRYAGRGNIVYPYWRYGSAGVGTAVIRYYRLLREPALRDLLDRVFVDTNRKYSVLPGFFKGLSGKGEFLLDMYQLTGDERFLDGAYRVASGVALFRIEKPDGLAFPGETLRRITCDYGTGSAGVAHFLHRLTHRDTPSAYSLDGCFDAARPA